MVPVGTWLNGLELIETVYVCIFIGVFADTKPITQVNFKCNKTVVQILTAVEVQRPEQISNGSVYWVSPVHNIWLESGKIA